MRKKNHLVATYTAHGIVYVPVEYPRTALIGQWFQRLGCPHPRRRWRDCPEDVPDVSAVESDAREPTLTSSQWRICYRDRR